MKSLNLYDEQYVRFQRDGKECAVLVQQDECPLSPREWDNLDFMICWHRNYRLGDRHDYKEPHDLMQSLARELLTMDELRAAIEDNRTNLAVRYDEEGNAWEIIDKRDDCVVVCEQCPDDLFAPTYQEDLLDNLGTGTLCVLLQQSGEVALLPLYLYDHSGITMSTGSFGDPWDSGQVGWIYMTKEIFLAETGWGEALWPRRAIEMMQGAVETYDQYLTGDVYGFTVFENTGTDADPVWEETDESCWGFYGSDIKENGIADNVPGLLAAIESGAYETGNATAHKYITITYEFA